MTDRPAPRTRLRKQALDLSGLSTREARQELGVTGLTHYGGRINEEWLRELRGPLWRRVVREMRDNDPVIGAVLFAVEMLVRQVTWRVEPGGESPADAEAAEFLESCMHDMSHSWESFVSEVLSMLPWGFSPHEIVYKQRRGFTRDPATRSQHADNRIGWRKLPIRAQDTVYRWEIAEDGGVDALEQLTPQGHRAMIPIQKLLLFRTTAHKGNPEGRALDPETLLPTPDGWRRLDEIVPGDKVFDERGLIRYVTARADWEDRPCYEVVFNGGERIIADANHVWCTQTLKERGVRSAPKQRTTEEIAATVRCRKGTLANHSIPWAGTLDYVKQELLVDPWFLGLWLGDGTSRTASIACHVEDAQETAALITACGYRALVVHNGPSDGNGREIRVGGDVRWSTEGPVHKLRQLGVLQNKHIPERYLRANSEQRTLLLSGLMDSDGTVTQWGQCEFTNTNKSLVEGVAELVRSLGCAAFVSLRKRANGVTHQHDSWSVKFTPDWSPFRLSRKRGRSREIRARKNHYVQSVLPVEPRRTVCIETDGASHMFLVGRSMVPTHNSILRNAYRPWFFKKRMEELEGIGTERDLAGLPVALVPPRIMQSGATPEEKATYEKIKEIVRNIRRDEQEGVVFPAARDDKGHLLYEIKLLSTGGQRQFDIHQTIVRYDQRIAMTALADFILLGHEKVGSFALSSDKTDLFAVALGAWLDEIKSVVNRHAVPRLFALNAFSLETLPTIEYDDLERPDLAKLGEFISKLAGAGAPLFPDDKLENALRGVANLPPVPEDDGSLREGVIDQKLNPPTPPPGDGEPPDDGKPPDDVTKRDKGVHVTVPIELGDTHVTVPEREAHYHAGDTRVSVPERQAIINQGDTHVTVPERETKVKVEVPKHNMHVHGVSKQVPVQVDVHVPPQPAPDVHVNVPPQPAPDVNVNVPPQPAPRVEVKPEVKVEPKIQVDVKTPEPKGKKVHVRRTPGGNLEGTIEPEK